MFSRSQVHQQSLRGNVARATLDPVDMITPIENLSECDAVLWSFFEGVVSGIAVMNIVMMGAI